MITIFKKETCEAKFNIKVADPYICRTELASGTECWFGFSSIEEAKTFLKDMDIDISEIQYE